MKKIIVLFFMILLFGCYHNTEVGNIYLDDNVEINELTNNTIVYSCEIQEDLYNRVEIIIKNNNQVEKRKFELASDIDSFNIAFDLNDNRVDIYVGTDDLNTYGELFTLPSSEYEFESINHDKIYDLGSSTDEIKLVSLKSEDFQYDLSMRLFYE
ncbi:hypothetical protein [Floccifex sp.]|uniref:hypothetical protein n=1 Tax=Floccifex sp. TaxID=2815810 RepID=UPI002A76673C|nr:hypothetical protein [Floccifex sp.]MDD7282212.1 hypothetical protein [Erysipelotrichaceae bacterium]MDY2957737.1 hypothetical protein [Floccifex sp.]